MKRTIALLIFATTPALLAPVGCGKGAAHDAPHEHLYTCSMHPAYFSDKPGDCPVCGMKLVRVPPHQGGDQGGTPAQVAPPPPPGQPTPEKPEKPEKRDRKPLLYRNPMNASDTSPVPRKDSMGMDYVPVYADESAGGDAPTPGHAAVQIDPERRRLIGLTTALVRRGSLDIGIRTVGRVAVDERRVAKVQPRFDGYVERLYADYTGKFVKKGQVLAAIYSPELLVAQNELLLAIRSQPALTRSGLPEAAEAARTRLRLLGVSDAQLDRVAKEGKALHTIDVVAPIAGFVTTKNVVQGSRITAEQPLFEIEDLSHLWVLAEVYEYEVARVQVGMTATITLAYRPGLSWHGRISYIYPSVDEKTRTVRVRIEVPNPRGELKTDMFADVVIASDPRQALLVPEDAVLDSGTRKIVFRSLGDGRLEPREIETGGRAGGLYEVRAGLREGESVASGASFLLDSESRLRAAISEMAANAAAARPAAASPPPPASAPTSDGGRP